MFEDRRGEKLGGGHVLAVKDSSGKFCHVSVSPLVWQYVRQLESYILHPEMSKLKELYPERFGGM